MNLLEFVQHKKAIVFFSASNFRDFKKLAGISKFEAAKISTKNELEIFKSFDCDVFKAVKAMLHEAICLATCNATMTNKKPFKLQRGSYKQLVWQRCEK